MSGKVDERIVTLEFDNERFAKGVQETQKGLESLKDALTGAEKTSGGSFIDRMKDSLKGLDAGNLKGNLESAKSSFSALDTMKFAGVFSLTQGLMNFAKQKVGDIFEPIITGGSKRAKNIEKAKFQFSALKLEAEQLTEAANQAVTGTAYGLDEAAVLASQFAATGIFNTGKKNQLGENILQYDKMAASLRTVAGVAAMTGSSYSEMGQVFGKIAGQGRVMGDDLNRLSSRGLNAASVLAEGMGKSEGEVRKMVSQGKVSFNDFVTHMGTKFEEAAGRANETYEGAVSQFGSIWSRVGAMFFTPYYTGMRDLYNSLTVVGRRFEQILKPLGGVFEAFWGGVSERAKNYIEPLAGFFDSLLGNTEETKNKLQVGLGFFEGLKVPMENAFKVLDAFVGGLKRVYGFMSPQKVDEAGNAFARFMDKLRLSDKAANGLERTFAGLFAAINIVLRPIKFVIKFLAELMGVSGAVIDNMFSFTGSIGDMLVALDKSLENGTAFGGIFGTIGDILMRVARVISSGLIWAINTLGNTMSFLHGIAKKVFGVIGGPLNSAMKLFSDALGGAVGGSMDLTGWLGGKLSGAFSTLARWSGNGLKALQSFGSYLGDKLGPIASRSLEGLKKLWSNLNLDFSSGKAFLSSAGSAVMDIGRNLADKITEGFRAAWDWIKAFDMDKVKDAFNAAKDYIANFKWNDVGTLFQKGFGKAKDIGDNIQDVMGNAWDWLKTDGVEIGQNVMSSVGDGISNAGAVAWPWLKDVGGRLWEGLLSGTDAALKGLNEFFGGALESFLKFKESVLDPAFANGLTSAGDFVAAAWEKVKNIFDGIGGRVSSMFNGKQTAKTKVAVEVEGDVAASADSFHSAARGIGDVIKDVADYLKNLWNDTFGKLDLKDWLTIGAFAGGLAALKTTLDFINSLKSSLTSSEGVMGSVKGLVDSVGGVFTSLSGTIDAATGILQEKQKGMKYSNILKMIGGIVLIAGAIWLLGKMKPDELSRGLVAMSSVFVGLKVMMKELDSLTSKVVSPKAVGSISLMLLALSGSMLIMAFAMKKFGEVDAEGMLQAILAVAILSKSMSNLTKTVPKNPSGLMGAAASMIAMAGAVLLLSVAVERFGTMNPVVLVQGLIGVTTTLLGLSYAMKIMGSVKPNAKAAVNILALAGAVAILGFAVKGLGSINFGAMIQGMVGVLGLVAGLTIATKSLGSGGASLKGAASLAILALSVGALSGAVMALALLPADRALRGVFAISSLIAVLAGSARLLTGATKGAAVLVALSAAMGMLVPPIIALSLVPADALTKALIALAAGIVILGGTAVVLGLFAPKLLLLASAFKVFAIAVTLMSVGVASVLVGLALFTAALSGLIRAFDKSDNLAQKVQEFAQIFPELGKKLAEGMVEFTVALANAGPKLTGALVKLIMSIITETLKGIAGEIGNWVKSLAEIIVNALSSLAEMIGPIVKSLADVIVAAIEALEAELPRIIAAIFSFIDTLFHAIIDGISNQWPGLLTSIGDFFVMLWDAIVGFCSSAWEVLSGAGKAIVDALAAGWNASVTWLTETVPETLGGWMNAIGSWFSSGWETVKQWAINLGRSIADGFNSMVGTVGQAASWLGRQASKVGEAIGSFASSVWQAAVNIGRRVGDGFNSMVGAVGQAARWLGRQASNVGQAIGSFAGSTWNAAVNIGRKVGAGLSSMVGSVMSAARNLGSKVSEVGRAIGAKIGEISSAVGRIVRALLDGLGKAASSTVDAAKRVGSNICSGIVNGIKNGIAAVTNAARDIARRALDAAKSVLGIKSPSREFAKIGDWSMQGFAKGLSNSEGVVEAAKTSGNTAMQALREAIAEMENEGLLDDIGDPVIRPVVDLSDIRASEDEIRSIFGDSSPAMAGSVAALANRVGSRTDVDAASSSHGGTNVIFNQTNNSPVALSTSEIYRQTRNQITAIKEYKP